MIAGRFKKIRVLEIIEDGTMFIRLFAWDDQDEYSTCECFLEEIDHGPAFIGEHHRPWVGVNATWLDVSRGPENPVAGRLLGETVDGPVVFSGVIPDNEGRADDNLLEMSDLTVGDWGGRYLPTDVPLTLVNKAVEAHLEIYGEFMVGSIPPNQG